MITLPDSILLQYLEALVDATTASDVQAVLEALDAYIAGR